MALANTLWTIGHSTREIEEFIDLLSESRIEAVVDVRRYAGSRRNPQFNPEELTASLVAHGIAYIPMPSLGGRREPRPDSVNTTWKNTAFRGYADYMQTQAFAAALDRLDTISADKRVALMCAEAVWWSCHRALIADALKARGVRILHILGSDHYVEHPFTAPARIIGGQLTYASSQASLL
jgi:uncharacterized protein (DUF488 family)